MVVTKPSDDFIDNCARFVGSTNIRENQMNIVWQHIFIEVIIFLVRAIFLNRLLFLPLAPIFYALLAVPLISGCLLGFYQAPLRISLYFHHQIRAF